MTRKYNELLKQAQYALMKSSYAFFQGLFFIVSTPNAGLQVVIDSYVYEYEESLNIFLFREKQYSPDGCHRAFRYKSIKEDRL